MCMKDLIWRSVGKYWVWRFRGNFYSFFRGVGMGMGKEIKSHFYVASV